MLKILPLCLLLSLLVHTERTVEVIKWPTLESYINQQDEKIHIINFWATWCKPCVEELPDFEKIHAAYKDKKVEVILVSLDQASLANTKVKTYIEKNNITAKTVVLDEVDFNKWIDRVDSTWSGSIPATLIVYSPSKHKQFYEQQFTYSELDKLIHTLTP